MTAPTPDMVGKYRIAQPIGTGSQGSVYLAYDPDLDREVALKTLHPHLTTGEVLDRFVREARILAQVDHSNIATVFDVGRDPQTGLYYFAMERVPHSVEEMLEIQGRLSADRAVRIVQEAASALEAARRAGITHHDVKPDNLLITSLDDEGAVRLIDFGIARAADSGSTQAGAMWGTPYYMAPEQWSSVRGDTRSDVYSLGVTLYRLISGTLPFDSDLENPVARNVEISRMHAEDDLTPLSGVDEDLWWIIIGCLMKDPDERFQTPGDLARALERYRAGESATARAGRRAGRGFPWSKAMLAFAGLLIGAVILIALVGFVGGNFPPIAQPSSGAGGAGPPAPSLPESAGAGLLPPVPAGGAPLAAVLEPTPTPTETSTATPTETPTATQTATPAATPSDAATLTPTPTPTPAEALAAAPTPTAMPNFRATVVAEITATAMSVPTATPTFTPTPTATLTPTPAQTATFTPTPTPTPTVTPTSRPHLHANSNSNADRYADAHALRGSRSSVI